MIVILSGGVGGARMARALTAAAGDSRITVIVNTGDDLELWGLYISPDIDSVLYTLAEVVDDSRGWGYRDDTYTCLNAIGSLGEETWFKLGDTDLATHIFRTKKLRAGWSLTQVTEELCLRLGIAVSVLPMTDDPVTILIKSREFGEIPFHDYFVKHQTQLTVEDVFFSGINDAKPGPKVLEAIYDAKTVVVAPSNPLVSIAPILALEGVHSALTETKAPVIAVSPLIGGKTVKGPADRMLRQLGYEPSAKGIAAFYDGILDGLVIDKNDAAMSPDIVAMGLRVKVCNTLMQSPGGSEELAKTVLTFADELRRLDNYTSGLRI